MSLSGIRTLPHQIEAVYQAMLPQPRLRFLLADDPGAGKTIMAGLLIKELKLREAIERVLILCPAPLTIQWQDEMLRWFGESFDIIFSAVDQQQLTNPWQRSSQVISSIDYAKQDDVRERVWQQRWDLVVVDEAHKCSARTASGGQGREPKVATTKRYDLVSRLTSQADHVLLLTATPHHGDEDKFSHFLRLIDPDLFPEPHRLGKQATSIRKDVFRLGKDSPWSLRRLKEDLKDLNGNRLFPDRHAKTVTFRLNSEEYALYKCVTAYINEFIPQQTGQRRSSAALTRTVLQRRLVSSTCAIHESLKRRLKKQQDLLDELEGLAPAQRAKRLAALQGRLPDAEQDEDDLDEEVRDQLVDEYTAALELEQLRADVAALKGLVEQASRVRELASDSKLAALRKCLGEAQFGELRDGRGKLLLFTEHRATLGYVQEHLERWGFSTCEIHGGMNPHERKRAQEQFRTTAQVCVATEAAGEGINLQFCHLMINYDMPWNPTRLEQRLGRIHRIGQDRDVYAFNFVATESEDGQPIVEGRILHRLLQKLDTMNEALEGRVFDVIGEVLSLNDVNLPDMLREAAYDPRRLDEYLDQIDRIDPAKLKEYEEATGIALARSHVDFTGFQRRNLEVEEKRLMPRYVETQFIAAAKEVGLRVEPRADGLWRIEHVLADLRSDRLRSVQHLGKAEPSYRKVTFHKHHLEQAAHVDAVLMGPGHPLYAAVDEKLNEKLAELQGGVGCYVDPLTTEPYRLHFFEITIRGKDAKGNDVPLHGELVAVREGGQASGLSGSGETPDILPPGVTESELLAACVGPDLDHITATAVLAELRNACLYLHYDGVRYCFKKDPNVTKLIEDAEQSVSREEAQGQGRGPVREKIKEMLDARLAGHPAAVVWPGKSQDIPDEKPRFLVAYLPLEFAGESKSDQERQAKEYLSKYGDRPRRYRNGLGLAIPDKKQIEALRRAVRYLLAIERVEAKKQQLRLTRDQLDQLKERKRTEEAAAESCFRDLYAAVWLPRVENGELAIERVERGGRPLQATGIHERIMELLTSVGTPRVHGSVTPRKIAERVKLGEPVAQGEPPMLGIKASEVLESFFRDIAPPRLESSNVLRKGIARGVTEGTFAYTSGSPPALGPDRKFQVVREKLVMGRVLAEDEVDFESGFIMVPAAIPEAAAAPGAVPTEPGVPTPSPGRPVQPAVPGGAPASAPGTPGAGRQSTVRLKFKATRDQIFKAFPAIANLADKSYDRKVTLSVEGTSSEGFDPSWLRNAVEEPLDEADIEKLPEKGQ